MMLQVLHCPHCHGTDIVRHGQTSQASNGTGGEKNGLVAPACWTIAIQANRLRSNNRLVRGLFMRVAA